jgi:chromosome segregation ATPase
MKKTHYLTIFGLVITTLISGNIVLAQTNTATSGSEGRWSNFFEQKKEKLSEEKAQLETRKEKVASTTAKIEDRIRDRELKIASTTSRLQEREVKIASSTEARKIRLEERFKTGISNQIAKVNDRLGDAITRLTSTDERLKAHLINLNAKNVDTTRANALLAEAEAKLVIASEKVSTLATSLQTVLSGTISTTTKNTIKAKTTEANTSVKAAHEAFVKVVENLKPGRNGNGANTATSTLNRQATATTTP